MASVYRSPGGASRPAVLAPGELVWASIINALENPDATGKFRPVVLIQATGSLWTTMGLTTNPSYANGHPRTPIPRPAAVGLRRPGWLWGERTTPVAAIDVTHHIGWVDGPLAEAVIGLAGLTGSAAEVLRAAAREHGRPGCRASGGAG